MGKTNKTGPASLPTEDEQLFASPHDGDTAFLNTDPWRVLRIQSEFVDGFNSLAGIGPAVTVFGSARTKPGDPQYEQAVAVA